MNQTPFEQSLEAAIAKENLTLSQPTNTEKGIQRTVTFENITGIYTRIGQPDKCNESFEVFSPDKNYAKANIHAAYNTDIEGVFGVLTMPYDPAEAVTYHHPDGIDLLCYFEYHPEGMASKAITFLKEISEMHKRGKR